MCYNVRIYSDQYQRHENEMYQLVAKYTQFNLVRSLEADIDC